MHGDPTQLKILVVDDDQNVADLLGASLEFGGHSVAVTMDRAAALHEIRQNPAISIVVCDFQLGPVDAFSLVAEMRQGQPDLRAIVISGHTETYVRSRGHLDDVVFLRKPFRPTELLATVQRLSQSVRLDPPINPGETGR